MSAPSPAPTHRAVLPFPGARSIELVGDAVGVSVGAQDGVLRPALEAERGAFSAQEQRIIAKFAEGMGISQIVASEFTNGKGEPLTAGELYKQRSKEVQDVIRRYLAERSVS